MDVAIYGGSFNPPHVGHAMVAAWVLWTGRAEEVWLVPAWVHAFSKEMAPFERRVSWCEAMAGDIGPRVRVCTVEAELDAPSYTFHTLVHLSQRHPEHRLRLLLGADALAQSDQWHRWPELRDRFDPIVVGRAGAPAVTGSPEFPDVSSTEIRARLDAGRAVDHLVTRSVRALL